MRLSKQTERLLNDEFLRIKSLRDKDNTKTLDEEGKEKPSYFDGEVDGFLIACTILGIDVL